MVNVVLEECDN